ncbi:autotransporter domain-containing protein, partial [Fusobacterium ulcerans]|uniref:autotransporter domain-containing protein n=1 Tax=Fusobacterium ulcerans TaxID=861 RepID=UPI001D0B6FE4
MISNFNEVEKSLKRCLKEKVSITAATVVGFLIAGTVAFGGDVVDTESYNTDSFKTAIEEVIKTNTDKSGLPIIADKNFNGVKYVYDGEGVIERLITVTKGTTTLDKDTNISTEKNVTLLNIVGQDSEKVTSVTNNGTLTSTNKDWRPTVIVNGKYNDTSFTNSGTITKEIGTAIDLSSLEGKTATLTNSGIIDGNIKTDADVTGKVVINLKDTSKINGEFYFAGAGTRTINIDNNTDDLTITNEDTNDTLIRINNSDITLRGKIQSKKTTVELNNQDGDNTLTNYADIIGETGIAVADKDYDWTEAAESRTVKIINNGKITASAQGIYNNGYEMKRNKLYIENNGDILVNDFNSSDDTFYYSTGIYSASADYTKVPGKVVNNGNITIDLSSKEADLKNKYESTSDMALNIHGLRLHEHTEGYNNGKILVNSYRGIGVVLSDGNNDDNKIETKYGYFENNGTVEVNGENGIGVQLRGADNIIESINTEKGSILVSGAKAIGVKVQEKPSTFTNNGIIELKEGTTNGIGISIDKGTATNNGTIALEVGKDKDSATNNIAIANTNGTAKNTGKIQITDKIAEELKDFDISSLFTGNYTNTGMLVDKNGIAIEKKNDVIIKGDTTVDNINENVKDKEGSSLVLEGDTKITASDKDTAIKVDSLNVTGKVTIAKNEDNNTPVVIEGTTTNLDANGNLAIGDGAELKINGGRVNGTKEGAEEGTAVTFAAEGSTLTLEGTTFNGNIGEGITKGILKTTGTDTTVITGNVKAKELELAGTTAITGDITTGTMNVTAGETKIDGTITGAETINIGTFTGKTAAANFLLTREVAEVPTNVENATVTYSADSKIIGKQSGGELVAIDGTTGTTITIEANGMLQAEVDNTGKYVFSNSNDVTVKGDGKVQLLTSNINKKTLELKEGSNIDLSGIGIIGNDFYSYKDGTLTYKLDNVNNKILSDISNKSFVVNSVLSKDPNAREAQFDSIYSNAVYSETVKMAMDTLRMNEDAVLSLGGKPEEGKWTAQGKML